MGCIGTKPDQDSGGKTVGNDMGNRNQTAHYVKDPTTGSKAVSADLHQGLSWVEHKKDRGLMERRSVSAKTLTIAH